ncbi:hypothetical protein U3516DRAFT_549395 [Neocallimastix sp. 'constans']
MSKNCWYQNKPKPSKIVDILINNRYVVNLIYDQYIAKGSYKTVCEYVQNDERCISIVRRDIWKKKQCSNNDDDNLIEQLIDDNDDLEQSQGIITTNIIQKILTMDQDLIINDRNKLSSNKWLIVQRLISNGYNTKPLYTTTISSNNNNNNNHCHCHHQSVTRTENYLSSVLVCGKCDQAMKNLKKNLLIKCDCKNLVSDYINAIIFEILINLDIAMMLENNKTVDKPFMIKLYQHYQSVFMSKRYVDISDRIKRTFVLVFIHHIVWDDTNNRLRVYFHDTVQRITVDIKTTTDNDGLINGYELIKSSYDHNNNNDDDNENDDENNDKHHSGYDHNNNNDDENDDEHSSIKINHHLIL